MQTVKRLTLEDFKLNKLENSNEIDKLLGDAAADCHPDENPSQIWDPNDHFLDNYDAVG